MLQIRRMPVGQIGTNCYLLEDLDAKTCAVIDPGDQADDIAREIDKAGLTPKMILVTHGHFDHVLGLEEVYEALKAPVYMSHKDLTADVGNGTFFGTDWSVDPPDDTVFVSEGDEIRAGSLTFGVIETPGHTPGGLTFLCEDCLFTGDTLFRLSCGRYDFPGSSALELGHSLEKLRDLPGDYEVFPGHESGTTLEFERRFNPYMLNPWNL